MILQKENNNKKTLNFCKIVMGKWMPSTARCPNFQYLRDLSCLVTEKDAKSSNFSGCYSFSISCYLLVCIKWNLIQNNKWRQNISIIEYFFIVPSNGILYKTMSPDGTCFKQNFLYLCTIVLSEVLQYLLQ